MTSADATSMFKMLRTSERKLSYMIDMKKLLDQILAVLRNRVLIIKMVSYASIGVVNCIIDILIFTAAYRLLGLPLILSNVISWSVAVCGSYAMNSKITFRLATKGELKRREFVRFFGSGILGLIVATSTLVVLSHYTSILVAKLVSIAVSFGVNFSMSYFVVFRGLQASKAID